MLGKQQESLAEQTDKGTALSGNELGSFQGPVSGRRARGGTLGEDGAGRRVRSPTQVPGDTEA